MRWRWRALADQRALVIDFGGVLTTPLRDAFRSFVEREGLDYELLREAIRGAYLDPETSSVIGKFETGELEQEHFERELAAVLSRDLPSPIPHENLVVRMLEDLRLDQDMIAAVRSARRQGITTELLSNSWGLEYYPRDLLAELFDEIVISGEVGMRKPDPQIFEIAAKRIGLPPDGCVFVDDLPGNIEAAQAVGMHGVLHEHASATIPELERLLGVPLRDAVDNL